MKASVVILNWNGEALLRDYLPNVVKHTLGVYSFDVELVVADNGSTDGSVAFVRECFPQIRVLELGQNLGFAEGYNRAIQQVESEYVVLLNSDVKVTAGWLSVMIHYLDIHSNVAACQPKIRSIRNPDFFEHAGACGGFLDVLGYPFCRGRLLDHVELDKGQYDDIIDILWATGACLCIRRQAYVQEGGLDPVFFAHMEEIDLCWRLRSRGYRIVCIPESVVFHLGGATLNKENPHKTYLNYRNNLLMLYKNLTKNKLIVIFLIRFFLDYASMFVFLLSGKKLDALAVVRARFDFWKKRSSYANLRRENMLKATNRRLPQIYNGSILLNVYLKGCQTYQAWHHNGGRNSNPG